MIQSKVSFHYGQTARDDRGCDENYDFFCFQDAEITVLSEKISPETTGDGAAGLWLPTVDPDTPKDEVMYVRGHIGQKTSFS